MPSKYLVSEATSQLGPRQLLEEVKREKAKCDPGEMINDTAVEGVTVVCTSPQYCKAQLRIKCDFDGGILSALKQHKQISSQNVRDPVLSSFRVQYTALGHCRGVEIVLPYTNKTPD